MNTEFTNMTLAELEVAEQQMLDTGTRHEQKDLFSRLRAEIKYRRDKKYDLWFLRVGSNIMHRLFPNLRRVRG